MDINRWNQLQKINSTTIHKQNICNKQKAKFNYLLMLTKPTSKWSMVSIKHWNITTSLYIIFYLLRSHIQLVEWSIDPNIS